MTLCRKTDGKLMLYLENASKFYGEKLVFKDISLHAAPGSVTLLAGPNGCGKSTLMKIMAGLCAPSAGSRRLSDALRNIGYLGHQTCIYPELTALENLAFWAGMHKMKPTRDALLAALERMDLAPFAEERAGAFSRGMSQRLNLARVLLPAPELLLLDEPATGLDFASSRVLWREIAAARARGAAVVWISHSLTEELPLADYIAVIGSRTLAHYGPASEYQHV